MGLRNVLARLIVSMLVMAASAGAALAGDRAVAMILGYSPDSRYFAFEEFGAQDGSGFAFSTIYIVDLKEDRWVVGTPVRNIADSEEVPIFAIRARTRDQIAQRLADFEIGMPADLLAAIGDGVPDKGGKTLSFGRPGYAAGEIMQPVTLSLETFALDSAANCPDFMEADTLGYALYLTDEEQGGEPVLLHRDQSLPKSRGCPLDYRIYAAYAPHFDGDLSNAVALISVYPYGFEGPDRRFIAVPIGRGLSGR